MSWRAAARGWAASVPPPGGVAPPPAPGTAPVSANLTITSSLSLARPQANLRLENFCPRAHILPAGPGNWGTEDSNITGFVENSSWSGQRHVLSENRRTIHISLKYTNIFSEFYIFKFQDL